MNDPATSRFISKRLDSLKDCIGDIRPDVNPLEQSFKIDANHLMVGRDQPVLSVTGLPSFLAKLADQADFALM